MKKVIIIKKTGEIKSKKIKDITKVSNINIKNDSVLTLFNSNIKKSIKFKNNFKRYCDWELDDSLVSIFGCKKGRAGSENKYDLPPPEDNDLYFGEILIVQSKNDLIIDMSIPDFENFIELSFGGFDDLGSNDTEEEYDPELDRYESDFVVDDNTIEYDENYNPNEDEDEEEYKSSTNDEERTDSTTFDEKDDDSE